MMKFIKIDFPSELFLPRCGESTGGFIADVLPEERIEAEGYFQPPMFFSEEYKSNESQHNDKNYARVLKK